MQPKGQGVPEFWSRLKNLTFNIQRRLLALWIRHPTIVGREKLPALAGKAVCYVLQYSSVSDLALLEQSCADLGLPGPRERINTEAFDESLSFTVLGYSINKRESKRYSRKQDVKLLIRLKQYIEQNPQLDILLLPVIIYWGRVPAKEKSIWRLTFLQHWRVTGYLQRFIAILVNRPHITVQYSQPLALKPIVNSGLESKRITRKIHRLLRVHFRRQKLAVIGPDLSHRRTLINQIIKAPSVQKIVYGAAREQNRTVRNLEKRAHRYAVEIVANMSYASVRIMDFLVCWIFKKLYDSTHAYGLDKISVLAETHEIIYLPCHRSYIDFLLISFLLFYKGIRIPHIAAGNNLNIPIIGGLLKRCGGFFVRRSFSSALYATVFQEYLHLVFTRGHSVEFFIEGGRTRTGYMLPPKRGLLSMMLRSYLQDTSKPIAIVPVYIGYEKVTEEVDYLKELRGDKKQKENLIGLLSSAQRLRTRHGAAHANFAPPIYIAEFLDAEQPDWRHQTEANQLKWLPRISHKLSYSIVESINKAVTVLVVNLVACCMLATRKYAIQEHLLRQQLRLLVQVLKKVPVSEFMVLPESDEQKIIARAESLNFLERQKHPEGDILCCNDTRASLMIWYRNNILHVAILPALIATVWHRMPNPTQPLVLDFCRAFYPWLQHEYCLTWHSEALDLALSQCHDALEEMNIICQDSTGQLQPAATDDEGAAGLALFSGLIDGAFGHYFIVLTVLRCDKNSTLKLKTLISRSILLAQQMAELGWLSTPEFLDHNLIRVFARHLIRKGMVETLKSGELLYSDNLSEVIPLPNWLTNPDFLKTAEKQLIGLLKEQL